MIKKNDSTLIALNKLAFHNYFIEKKINAGIVLQGWEVKSLRTKKVNITNGYILLKDYEAYIIGINIQPLITVFKNNDIIQKNQKLLLHKKELNLLYSSVKKKGYTIILLSLFWQKMWAKAQIAIAKGKKKYDDRQEMKKKEWQINQKRIIKKSSKNKYL